MSYIYLNNIHISKMYIFSGSEYFVFVSFSNYKIFFACGWLYVRYCTCGTQVFKEFTFQFRNITLICRHDLLLLGFPKLENKTLEIYSLFKYALFHLVKKSKSDLPWSVTLPISFHPHIMGRGCSVITQTSP